MVNPESDKKLQQIIAKQSSNWSGPETYNLILYYTPI